MLSEGRWPDEDRWEDLVLRKKEAESSDLRFSVISLSLTFPLLFVSVRRIAVVRVVLLASCGITRQLFEPRMPFLYQSAASLNISGMAMRDSAPGWVRSGTDERRRCRAGNGRGAAMSMSGPVREHWCTKDLSEAEWGSRVYIFLNRSRK